MTVPSAAANVDVGNTFASGSTGSPRYAMLVSSNNRVAPQTTLALVEAKMKHAVTVSKLRAKLRTNANVSQTQGPTLFVNGAATSLAVSFAPGVTGLQEDLVNSAAVVAGDLVCWRVATSVEFLKNWVIDCITAELEHASAAVSPWSSVYSISVAGNLNAAGTTYYQPVLGKGPNTTAYTTQAEAENTLRAAGTVSYARIRISANTASSTHDHALLVNGVASSLTISVAAGVTGYLEDLVNEPTVADGDLVCWRIVRGAGSGSVTCSWWHAQFLSDDTTYDAMGGEANGATISPTITREYTFVGGSQSGTVGVVTPMVMPHDATITRLRLGCDNSGADVPFTLYVNGAASALTVTATPAAFTRYEDSTHSVSVSAGDELHFLAGPTPSGTATFTPRSIAVLINGAPAAPAGSPRRVFSFL